MGSSSKDKQGSSDQRQDKFARKSKRVQGRDVMKKDGKTYFWNQYFSAYTLHAPVASGKNPANEGRSKEELDSIQRKVDRGELNAFQIELEEEFPAMMIDVH